MGKRINNFHKHRWGYSDDTFGATGRYYHCFDCALILHEDDFRLLTKDSELDKLLNAFINRAYSLDPIANKNMSIIAYKKAIEEEGRKLGLDSNSNKKVVK